MSTWNIQLNSVKAQNDRWQILPLEASEFDLINVYMSESMNADQNLADGSRLYYGINFQIDADKVEYTRSVYRLIDVMGDVGGFLGIL